ncbi:MAG: hypothetical protein AAF492_28265, partial [Verrucomicrobiota bacterium]
MHAANATPDIDPEISPWTLNLGFQLKTHLRDSEHERFATGHPSGATLETVDPGTHVELSVLSLRGSLAYEDRRFFRAKVDIYDLYERNPTSDDKDIDVDEFWFIFGTETRPWQLPEENRVYVKAGKFHKFEKQTDRHLESYGLVSTAFNRFEDQGFEAGFDLGNFFYAKASLTAGNPVFIRDPNALAGDNGTGRLFDTGNTQRNAGIPILYDAEVEDLDWDGDYLEKGFGIGTRLTDEDRNWLLNVLFFSYERDLQDEVDLAGTRYGGDLDVLDAPGAGPLNGVRGEKKREKGVTAWLYYQDFTFFMQYVDQKVAGWHRRGWELEGSWQIELPTVWHIDERPLFSRITPAVRYSDLD